MPALLGNHRLWVVSFFFTIFQTQLIIVRAASEPALFLNVGRTGTTPFGPARMDFGWRGGLSYSTSLPAGELHLPLELGLSVRTVLLRKEGWFEHDRFTDLQMPLLFHNKLFWKRLEYLFLWVPSYTLEMVQISSFAGRISDAPSLRTRVNMGLGSGLQIVLPLGVRIRGYWIYNLFSPWPASRLTWGELEGNLAVPLLFRRSPE